MNQSPVIEFFKKDAKRLLKQFNAKNEDSLNRVRRVLTDVSDVGLMKAQHVVAVEYGFSKWEELVSASNIQLRLAIAMEKVPQLTDFGIGIYESQRLSTTEWRAKFLEERADLRWSTVMVQRTVDWLKENVPPIKTINPHRTSYGMKHVAEKHMGTYLTNGQFIAAALIAGYPYRLRQGSANVQFGMSEKAFNKLAKEGKGGWDDTLPPRRPSANSVGAYA